MRDGLQIDHLRIEIDGVPLVTLTESVAPGEVLTIMGPSGSGKSTLLHAIVGAVTAEFRVTGRIALNGRDLTGLGPRDRCIGLIFQDDLLFPHMSVATNLAFALPPTLRGQARRDAVEQALTDADLEGFAERDPATLSGGQRARVALMRTLLSRPLALLLDEPFSRLDAALRDTVRRFTFDTICRRDLPALLVTHDAEDARAAGGRVVAPTGQPVDPG